MAEVRSCSGLSEDQRPSSDVTRFKEASQEALAFIETLCEEDFRSLLFDDHLMTFSDLGKEVGEMKISVSEAKHSGQPCFLVHALSQGTIDDIPCGTSVTAFVSKRLETLEQQHSEYVKLANHPINRKTVITRQDGDYVIDMCVKQGEETRKVSQRYSSEGLKGLIPEGSNLLLLRVLARKGASVDELTFLSFDSEVNVCQTTYKSITDQTEKIAGQDLKVTCFERKLLTSQDDRLTWRSFMTSSGHLVKRLQVGSPVVMVLLSVPQQTDEPDPKPVFPKKPLNWEEDMQLRSKYEDRKEELVGSHKTYMRDHPELGHLISDFVQFVLLRKPADILAFSAEYFEAFAPERSRNHTYLNSETPQRHPEVKSNHNIEFLSKVSYTN